MPIEIYLWHPIFVHFSVALLSVAVVLYLLSAVFAKAALRKQWVIVAEWNLWVGFGLTTLTLLFGWLAFNTVDHADDAHEPMIVHATLALLTASGFALLTLWSFWHRKTAGRYPSWLFVGSLLIFFALLLVTALRGGELVYRYGLAVNSPAVPASNTPLPERGDANAPEHHHDHHHHNHDKSQAQ